MYNHQHDCEAFFLALTIWREASNQPPLAQAAVGQSILTRVNHPGWWGSDIQSVVTRRWQYSALTAPGDPNLVRWPASDDVRWWDVVRLAYAILDRTAPNPTPDADSYHDVSIAPPAWTRAAHDCGRVGAFRLWAVRRDWELDAMPAERS